MYEENMNKNNCEDFKLEFLANNWQINTTINYFPAQSALPQLYSICCYFVDFNQSHMV